VIPADVINGEDEDLRTKIKKVLFIEENELLVIGKPGRLEAIEKKVDINNNFKDISF
jgi:hypothetical protein